MDPSHPAEGAAVEEKKSGSQAATLQDGAQQAAPLQKISELRRYATELAEGVSAKEV